MKTADFLDSRLILLVLATKTPLFLANELIFDTSAQKRIVFQAAWITIQTVLIKGVICTKSRLSDKLEDCIDY